MKLLFSAVLITALSSCSKYYLVSDLHKYYNSSMDSGAKILTKDPETSKNIYKTKGEILETYKVYSSSAEVENKYEVIAFYQHSYATKKGLKKKWLTQSMLKCAELGGNAIILQSTLTNSIIIREFE